MFGSVIPFCYLPQSLRSSLGEEAALHDVEPGTVLVHQDDDVDERVFVLLEGLVEAFDEHTGRAIGRIGSGHYFGERAALFSEKRNLSIRAVEPSRLVSISGKCFLSLFAESPTFAQVMANILRHKQGIFVGFERFLGELLRTMGRGQLHLESLLPLYRSLEPALHRGANQEALDPSALSYAVRRLPDNVTRCFAYYLTETLPHHQSRPDELFLAVPTAARRRAVYELLPGKNMVLIRDGISDVLDFVTCLCLFVIEARKLRRRMLDLDVLRALGKPGWEAHLPFSEAELEGIREVWPEQTHVRLREVLLHHEDLYVSVFRHLDNYNSAHSERWTNQTAELTQEVLGAEPALLPEDLEVHIISSNTHSVSNCLSPWFSAHGKEILDWARSTGHALCGEPWSHEMDLCYALARDYFRAHPEAAREKAQADRNAGIHRMRETAFTGIEVQLIDANALGNAGPLDPDLPAAPAGLVINIDYAFGEQGEHIIANLIALFGHRIKSVNVLGKAGALVGKRGDILAASAFLEQSADLFQPIPKNAVNLERLRSLTDRTVHVGPVLTVAGTLLQNERMLYFNKHVWGCTGLEMEGTYYLSEIVESMNRGSLSRDVELRFLYYVSDLPLDHGSNLSGGMRAIEGIPPLYAITREILLGLAERARGVH
jgi:hypothetical protein